MRRFTAVLARKGLAADWQFGAMPGSTAAAPVFLAQRRLQRGQEENHVLAFDVSKAFDTAPHGALALLLRHMGVPKELIWLFHILSCGSLVRIVTAHGQTPSIRLHRGLRQGSAASAVLYLLLLEPLLRSLACKARGDTRHVVAPVVQAYCDDLLLIAHSVPQFLEYAAAIAQYLTDMGMSLNVGKCAYANTARIPTIMVCLNPGNTAAPWVCLRAKGTVPYLGLRLDPRGIATMKEKHVLRCEAVLGWCKNTLGPASVPHEVMAAVVGGIVRYAAPYLSDTAEAVVKLNAAIKAAALQFEKLPKDLSNVAVRYVMDCAWRMYRLSAATPSHQPWLNSCTTGRRRSGMSCEPCFETCTSSTECADSSLCTLRHSPRTMAIRGWTGYSGRWGRCT